MRQFKNVSNGSSPTQQVQKNNLNELEDFLLSLQTNNYSPGNSLQLRA